MFDANTISALCDIAGVAGFTLALWQHMGSRTHFRISDTKLHMVGKSDDREGLHVLVSFSLTNLSSRTLCVDTLLLQACTSDAIHPLSSTRCEELLRSIPHWNRSDRLAIEGLSALPVNVPAHTGCHISLCYPICKNGSLFESLFAHSGAEPNRLCKRQYCVPTAEGCLFPLSLVFSARGRTVRKWLDMDRITLSGFSGSCQED